MRSTKILLVGAIALLCGIGFGISAQNRTSDPVRWEYQTLHGSPDQLAGFNGLGQGGWELAAVSCQDQLGQCAYFFKRRR